MFSEKTRGAVASFARAEQLEPAVLLAVVHIESGGRSHAVINGRPEPLIRFEGHYFDRRLPSEKRERARAMGLSSPKAGAVANPRSQKARWALLERAVGIHPQAAYESVSWGVGQVMGAHWAWLGFASVDALVAEARQGLDGQLRLMLRYIEKAGLRRALERRDWQRFAYGYNGAGFRKTGYDKRLARAYERYSRRNDAPHSGSLRQGARGSDVSDLQKLLSALGYPLQIDGVFGDRTAAALKAFQRDHNLEQTGVADPQTWMHLKQSLPLSRLSWSGFLNVIGSLLRGWRRPILGKGRSADAE